MATVATVSTVQKIDILLLIVVFAAITSMTREEFLACVAHEQALARFKCEQELVRLDTELADEEDRLKARLSTDARLAGWRHSSEDPRAFLAPLRILSLNLMHIEKNVTSLKAAAAMGQTELVDILLAYVHPCEHSNAALINACINGHLDTVRRLLSDKRVDDVVAPLRFAVRHGRAVIVREILSTKATEAIAVEASNSLSRPELTLAVAQVLVESGPNLGTFV